MATAILQPQDCVRRHRTLTFEPPGSFSPGRNVFASRSRRRKRSPVGFQANREQVSEGRSMVVKFPTRNLVMGQVKILKRGEACDLARGVGGVNLRTPRGRVKSEGKGQEADLALCSTDRLGPEPEMVQRQVRIADGVYAGSAIFASPPPSSLPLPGFLGKVGVATSDLRRILRLDLV